MQDMEFTIEDKKLYMLQTRNGKRTAKAALKIACDLVDEGMIDEKAMDRTKSIILSMTPQERSNPGILNLSRKNRIARGAGVEVAEVNRLVKQFEQSKKMMKQMPGLTGGKMNMGKRGGFKLPF